MIFPRKVYLIRHKNTGRIYIGSSCKPEKRYLTHMYHLKSGTHPVGDMQKDFDDYGSNFTFTLIDTISDSSEALKEYQWMNNFRSHIRGVGYNYKDNVMKLSQGIIKAEEQNEKTKNEICRLLQKTRDSDLLDFILKMLQKSN